MSRRKFPVLMTLASALVALTWGSGQAYAKKDNKVQNKGKKAQIDRKEAFKRAAALGLKPGVAGWKSSSGAHAKAGRRSLAGSLPAWADPGGVPHYFGPWANWAYSPLPKGPITSVTVTNPGSGYTAPVVTIADVYTDASGFTPANVTAILGNGVVTGLTVLTPGTGYVAPVVTITGTGTGASASALFDGTGAITGFTITSGGSGYSTPVAVAITDDPLFCGAACGSGATASAAVGDAAIIGFNIADGGSYTAPWVTITDPTGTGATADASIGGTLTGGIVKFVDKVPGLGPANANTLVPPGRPDGQYIPVAVAGTFTSPNPPFPVSDYYVIGLVEFYEKMHRDLPPTRQRGYVQLESPGVPGTIPLYRIDGTTPINYPGTSTQVKAVDYPHFLGPAIVASRDKAVRIKFLNLLPTGAGGDLFIPVDETVMGSGYGPAGPGGAGSKYTQNRATVHLHGNNTVWISDGTPHQWITPAGEATAYPKGVSVKNVPDMWFDPVTHAEVAKGTPGATNDPGDGSMTFYYTNAMSARLMFYHDHAMGITRLNVYAGEAAGYVVTDQVETDMIAGTNVTGVNPLSKKVLPDLGIPLVIQDRTFVDATTVFGQDPTWNWGTGARAAGKITEAVTGDLWVPHVYMSAQNPGDLSGMNAFGRWHYGPWFTPPTPTCTAPNTPAGCIEMGPMMNEYFGQGAWEPEMRPGVPNPSMPGEAFNDTPIVNGTAYPYIELEPKAYRFRILNAANDRFLNLQLYVAADKTAPTTAGSDYALTPARLCDGSVAVGNCTEVKMIPVAGAPNQAADTPSGIPDPATAGPAWWQIGTEGGFLAKPAIIPQQPVGWNLDPTAFNVGNVNQHSLILGTAERADVVVDFSAFAGKTLILYNDAPAAFPAGVPTYDYFTGVANQMDVGGAPTTQPGYGPNTRTIMQIRVTLPKTTPTDDVTFANLEAVFAKTAGKRGVFEASQDPIVVPQAAYNSAYGASFTNTAAGQFFMIGDLDKTFQPINKAGALQPAVTLPLQMKAMHDEMGGVYDTMFGRMSGMLGLTNPQRGNAFLIPYGYASPPTDVIKVSPEIDATPIGSLGDGTQIWRIFHNGVDTHTIHTHLFTSQLVNRIGQDNWMVDQEPSELGWKDTFRINPLEVTFLAMRPVLPTQAQVPFEVPDSVRLIDPTLPEGASLIEPAPAGWFDPAGLPITEILNHPVNFGWEYVWHCHILAHEEMDMMHALVAAVPPLAPTTFSAVWDGKNNPSVLLNWNDNSSKEAGYRIQRATNAAFTSGLTTINLPANTVTYQDKSVSQNTAYWYRVIALGARVGDTFVYPGSLGFPTLAADAAAFLSTSNPVPVGNPPATLPLAPTNLTAAVQAGPQVTLTFRDNATNETGFPVERCSFVAPATTCSNFAQIAIAPPKSNTGNTTFVDATVTPGNSYLYRVAAVNANGTSAFVTLASAAVVPAVPPAPTGLTVGVQKANGNNYTATLTWAAGANPSTFTIQRATNLSFTTNLTTSTVAGNLRTATQTVSKNTTYYFRIRANNSISGSSAWTNALPFPIRTGN